MATLDQAIDRFTNQLAEIGPDAFASYPGGDNPTGFQQYLLDNQNKISGGTINTGRAQDQKIVLYGDDQKAYGQDIQEFRVWFCQDPIVGCLDDFVLDMTPGNEWNVDDPSTPHIIALNQMGEQIYPGSEDIYLPLSLINNISQMMFIDQTVVSIDPYKADEVLKGRKIYELITEDTTRQDEINKFFELYFNLKIQDHAIGYNVYPWCTGGPIECPAGPSAYDNDNDNLMDTWGGYYDDDPDPEFHSFEDFYAGFGISQGGDYITWRNEDTLGDANNENKTLEWLRDDLNRYFLESDYASVNSDIRPEYENRSLGYLKVRNLNHAVIIRNEEGPEIGLTAEKSIGIDGMSGTFPIWQVDGFTITMWVRFLSTTGGGTLFNFGNPLRSSNPKGFMLDTFMQGDSRYVRLVLRDFMGKIRDSHFGGDEGRINTADINYMTSDYFMDVPVLHYTEVPVDLKEWYFIVATYDRGVNEDVNHEGNPISVFEDTNVPMEYWNWNIEVLEDGSPSWEDTSSWTYTSNSGYGSQCKVEIISRSDLLRARGFQP